MKRISQRVGFATLVLALAIGGAAFAAGSITGASIKDGSVTGKDIKNRSLTPQDFTGSVRGPQGEPGPRGPQGIPGLQGPAGQSATSAIEVVTAEMVVAGGEVDAGTVLCPPGQTVISGGFATDAPEGEVFVSVANEDRTGWIVALDNLDSPDESLLAGQALCAGTGKVVAAGATAHGMVHSVDDSVAHLIAARRATHD